MVNKINLHVMPQSLSCPFCLFDFDAVGKFEHFSQDAEEIVDTIGVKVVLP